MQQPIVSIIMSTYNGSKYISKAIESVLNQTYKNFEFIIINDASTDNVENIILEYQKKDNRIKYFKNEKNLKLTKSLNKGIENSNGKYIARIDDDDIWCDKDKLKKQVIFMENNPDYGLCGTSVILINENGEEIGIMKQRETDEIIRKNILSNSQFTHSSIIIRKSILDKVGGFYDENKKFMYVEDYELILRIGTISKFYNLPDFCVKYRILKTSITRQKSSQQKLNALKCYLKYYKYYPDKIKGFLAHLVNILLPKFVVEKLVKLNKSLEEYLSYIRK